MMRRNRLPRVSGEGLLVADGGEEQPRVVLIDSEDWYRWLTNEQCCSFTFQHPLGTFNARKERKGAGWYWYAYRRQNGKLRKAYLGKSQKVTLHRLNTAAEDLCASAGNGEALEALLGNGDVLLNQLNSTVSEQGAEHNVVERTSASLTSPAHALPSYLTPLLGREQEVQDVASLLLRPDVRLVTLVGPGGIGKTRLGVQVASEVLSAFADGVVFVPLAPLRDPELVLPTIAQVLGMRNTDEWSLEERLKAYLQARQVLLVLDNVEHLLPVTPHVVNLLTSCSGLKILVTSRTVLRLRGEYEFLVSPLALPDLKHLSIHEPLLQYAAIELFLQRVWALRPHFQLTPSTTRTVAEICVKLEGLPLALELAAARMKLLSAQDLLQRLEYQLPLLTYGASDAPERQQTMRNTIRWSYELLSPAEQRLFRRVSVFVGGFTVQAAEYLYQALGASASNVLDDLTSLLDKSLLQQREQADTQPRLILLETIREYGLECLAVHGEMETTHQAYTSYYLMLAEKARLELQGPQQQFWLEHLEQEHSNLRKVLTWVLQQKESEHALHLSVALARFWEVHGHLSEGYHWLEQALADSQSVLMSLRAWGLSEAAWLMYLQGKIDHAENLLNESLSLFRVLDDKRGCALACRRRGAVARTRGDYEMADALTQEALQLFKEVGDERGVAHVQLLQAYLAIDQGKYGEASSLLKACLSVFRVSEDKRRTALASSYLAYVLFAQGDLIRAQVLAEESLALAKPLDDRETLAMGLLIRGQIALHQARSASARLLLTEALMNAKERGHLWSDILSLLARVAISEGDYLTARRLFAESLLSSQEAGKEIGKASIAFCLEGLANLFLCLKEHVWAVRLWGMGAAIREKIGVPMMPIYQPGYQQAVARASRQLGKRTFASTWEQGRRMTLEEVFAAVADLPLLITAETLSLPPVPTPLSFPDELTGREVEVLRLVAQGLTDAQVAEKLVISTRTVSSHLQSIYSKIQVSSRSGATRYAIEHQL